MKKRPLFITKSFSVTLPKEVREVLDLEPGDCFDYETIANGSIILIRKECIEMPAFQLICMIPKEDTKR